MRFRFASAFVLLSLCCFAQSPAQFNPSETQVAVPHLIRISGQMQPTNSTLGMTFALYRTQNDTAPLWTETQNIAVDANGKYNALVGATKAEGIPLELFASGEAHWLGIRREGQPEQLRIFLVSVPYAMKAAEAETLAGHTAAEFVTQQNLGAAIQLKLQEPEIRTVLANPFASEGTPTTDGATNFTDSTTNQIVAVTQNGTGRLITGAGPSHTQVFAVDQNGEIHGTGLSLDGSAGRSISMGNNATSGGTGYQLLVRAGESASGSTDKRGGELQLAAGPGTGAGGSGDVVIQTAPPGTSGTSVNTEVTRHVYASSPVDMGGTVGSVLVGGVTLADGQMAAVKIQFSILAVDSGSDIDFVVGECLYVAGYPTDGSFGAGTANIGPDFLETGGSSNAGCGVGAKGNTWTFYVQDNLAFTPTVHALTYEIYNISNLPLILYANTSSTERRPLPSAMARAVATRAHPSSTLLVDAHGNMTVK